MYIKAYAIIYVYVFCLHICLVYYLHDIKSIHIPPKFHEYSIIFRQICPSVPSISVFPSRSFFLRFPRNLHGFLHVFSQVATDTWGRTEPGRLGPLTPWNPWNLEMEMSNKENREKTLVKV
jgi:hypothetical protein